jgi:hypothetical protein
MGIFSFHPTTAHSVRRVVTCVWDGQSGIMGKRSFHNDVYGTSLILSVDDDAVNHMVLEGFLKPKGYATYRAGQPGDMASGGYHSCVRAPSITSVSCACVPQSPL